MKNIIITGFMGTGKTETGLKLSRKLNCPFVDIDLLVEEMEKRKIADIFAEKGEDYFRGLETAAIKKALQKNGQVISTGGGALLKEENRTLFIEAGVLICLSASPEEIFRRIGSGEGRPLLEGKNPLNKIRMILSERQNIYDQVPYNIITDGKTSDEVVEEIIKLVKELREIRGFQEENG